MSTSTIDRKESEEQVTVTISKRDYKLFTSLQTLLRDSDFLSKLDILFQIARTEEIYLGDHTEDLTSAAISEISEWADEENNIWDEV